LTYQGKRFIHVTFVDKSRIHEIDKKREHAGPISFMVHALFKVSQYDPLCEKAVDDPVSL
jgi:hypothetical protein